MEIFENIRLRIGRAILAKKASSIRRNKFYSNISSVRKIGILWDASNPSEFRVLSKFHQKMHERGIEVKILGYFPEKNLPDQYTAVRYLSIIRRSELSYFYIPLSKESQDFISGSFDVIIDINTGKAFPLQYLLEMSQTGLRVGLSESSVDDTPLDMMISIRPPVNIDTYLNEVVEYLEMINSDKSKIV
jgi:hypothetical protein